MLSGTLMLRPLLKVPLKEPRMMLTHGMVKKGLKGLFLAALSKSAVDYRENWQFTGGFYHNGDTWCLQESFLWESKALGVVIFCSVFWPCSACDLELFCILKGD